LEVFSPEIQTIDIYLYQLKKYYDGTPLKFEDEDYEISEIAGGTTLNVSLNISMTDVGFLTLSSLNGNLAEYVEFKAMRGGTDVSDLFRIVFCSPSASNETYIPIEVLQRPIELTAKSAEKVWDGNVLTSPGYFISIGSLLKGHRIDSSCTIGEIYDVGTTSCFVYPDSIIIIDSAGNDVTKNYKITSKEGTLTILEPDQ
jgi:hypothetical protein